MSHLLQQSKSKHQSIELLQALEAFAEAVKASDALYRDIHLHLILNLRLFSRSDVETQRYLVQQLARMSRVWLFFAL